MPPRPSKPTLVLLAFACVYLFWGSTYLAIRIAGEQLPAPVVSGTRCLLSSVLIFGICLARGKSLGVPAGEGWKLCLIGVLFMSGNNMLLTYGEKIVPSGFASLVVSTTPIMIALMEAALPGGEALNRRGWAGTLLASAGIALLVWPSLHGISLHGISLYGIGSESGNAHIDARIGGIAMSRPLLGLIVLLVAALSFAVGSVLARRFHFKADTFVATGWQISAAAAFNIAVGAATGGLTHGTWTVRGSAAIVYLAVFGSLFGLVAFTYLLQNVPVTKVATYAFVNPVIAVLLGVLVLHERLDRTELAGMGVIVCAVAIVIFSRVQRKVTPDAVAGEETAGEPA